ncbi:MAG: NAD(P)/FAD-dependent oxidoreductase [Solirubrobacterales bacterium]|nr:NAD(P)/FAD-dependent oxidoreductase [Solirubrobacterales bacterium]
MEAAATPAAGAGYAEDRNGSISSSYDAIVVGGGHNGLTTAAYLARAGLKVVVLERRGVLGGACVTEEVWPGARVSRCSYVVSMLQPKVISDLKLKDFGYRAYPMDPAYAAMTEDGPIFFFNEVERTVASIARHSPRDAASYADFENLLERSAEILRPMLLREPPPLGSKSPGDIADLLREGARVAGMSRRDIHDLVRIFTMSVGDLLDDWFEHDGLKGSIASTGVVGVWAGPRTPGTAYNLLHHALGELDGISGAWGQVVGGMGAISGAIACSAEAAGATILTDAEVVSINVKSGETTGVTLASGEEIRAGIVASGAHPKTTVLDLVGDSHFPDEVVTDMKRYRTRGGSVKVNMVLDEAPQYAGVSAEDQGHLLSTGVNICPRSTTSRLPGRKPRPAAPRPIPTSKPNCPQPSTPA